MSEKGSITELGGSRISYSTAPPMEIVQAWPPNIDAIRETFPLTGHEIFAYGNRIYSPGADTLPLSLIAHEEVHQAQQGNDVESWWDRYLTDTAFRLQMEVEAHRVECRVACSQTKDREYQWRIRMLIARKLASPIYQFHGITVTSAMGMLK